MTAEPTITIRLPAHQRDWLNQQAQHLGLTRSDIIREAIHQAAGGTPRLNLTTPAAQPAQIAEIAARTVAAVPVPPQFHQRTPDHENRP